MRGNIQMLETETLRWAILLDDNGRITTGSALPASDSEPWLSREMPSRAGERLKWSTITVKSARLVMSHASKDDFQSIVRLERMKTNSTSVSISTKQMMRLFYGIPQNHYNVYVKKIVYSKPVYTSQSRKNASAVEWLDGAGIDYLDNVVADGGILRSVEFVLRDKPFRNEVKCTISRSGIFKSKYCHDLFFSLIATTIADGVTAEIDILRNRSRTSENNYEVRPLALQFVNQPFTEKSRQRLIKALAAMPGLSVSIYNVGNILTASVVDTLDGSTYTIAVYSEETMFVSPQRRASVESLERLVSNIGEKISEPAVYDYHAWISGA